MHPAFPGGQKFQNDLAEMIRHFEVRMTIYDLRSILKYELRVTNYEVMKFFRGSFGVLSGSFGLLSGYFRAILKYEVRVTNYEVISGVKYE